MRYLIILFVMLFLIELECGNRSSSEIAEKQLPDSIKTGKFFFDLSLIQNRTHRVGSLWMNVTNYGSFMKMQPHLNGLDNIDFLDECTGKISPVAEMPGGSGMEYLWAASLWCGGYLDSVKIDINGAQCTVFEGH